MLKDERIISLQSQLSSIFEKVATCNIKGWDKCIFDPHTGLISFNDIDILKQQLMISLSTISTKKIHVSKKSNSLTGTLDPFNTIRMRLLTNNKNLYVTHQQQTNVELDANKFVKAICILYNIDHQMYDLDINLKKINVYLKAAQRIHAPVYKIAEKLYNVHKRYQWLNSLAPQLKNTDGSDKHINNLLGNYFKYICCFSLIYSWCKTQNKLFQNIQIEAIPCKANHKDIYQLKLLATSNNIGQPSNELVICTEFSMSLTKLKNSKLELKSDDLNKIIDSSNNNFFKNIIDCMDFEHQQFDCFSNSVLKRDFFIDILLKSSANKFAVIEAKFRTDALYVIDELTKAIRTQNYEYTQFLKELYSNQIEPRVDNYLMSSYSRNQLELTQKGIFTEYINDPAFHSKVLSFTDNIVAQLEK